MAGAKSDRRKSVFFMLFVSYIGILLFCMVVGSIFYIRIESILVDNANQSNAAMLEQTARMIDSRMAELEQLTFQIVLHPRLPWLLDQKMNIEAETLYSFVAFMNEMSRYKKISSFIEDFYVYFAESDIVLSSAMKTDSKTFFNDIYRYPHLTYDQYAAEILSAYHHQAFRPAEEIDGLNHSAKVLTYINSLPMGDISNSKGSLVILIEERKLLDLLNNIESMQSGSVYILNAQHDILLSTAKDTAQFQAMMTSSRPLDGSDGPHFWEYAEGGTSMMAAYTTSRQNGWTYVSVIPKSIVLAQVETVKKWALLLISFCFAAGTVACYRLAYQNYRPLRDLAHAVMDKGSAPKGQKNEYELIRDAIAHLFDKKKDMEATLSKQIPVVRADFLSRLIRGHVDTDALSPEDLAFMDISFRYPRFGIIIVDIDDCIGFIRQDNEREWALVRFILTNICNEWLRDPAYATEMERHRIALLINRPDDGEGQSLHAFADELIRVMSQRFHTKITVAISSIHTGIDQIGECFNEAIFAMEYKMIKGLGSALLYEEVRHASQPALHYSMEMESQLLNFTRNGDFAHVEKILNQIHKANFQTGSHGITPELGRSLYFGVLNTLNRLSGSAGWSDQVDPAKVIAECATAEEMLSKIKGYYEIACQTFKKEQSGHSEQLYRKIHRYIQEHYRENTLSLTAMADHFEMNASYLSTFYKSYSGRNVTDDIAGMRMQEAKRLLAQTSLNMNEIAQRVGYASSFGFIRTFKKAEGITPGQYRTTLDPSAND